MPSPRQKKRLRKVVFTIITVAIVAIGSWMVFQLIVYRKSRFIRYTEFGIAIPVNYAIHGIDVSKYQELISWEDVQAMKVDDIQLGFAFIKATEGIGNTDPHFKRNWRKSKSSKMIRGAYHFFIASKDGRMQAENFIKRVDLDPGDLPPVLDVEQLNGVNPIRLKIEVQKWLDVVENYYKVKPIIYTNIDFYKRNLGKDFNAYPLWIAHYYQHKKPRIDREWHFWQHSDQGRVNGIAAKVDFNVFNGDSLEFRSLLLR